MTAVDRAGSAGIAVDSSQLLVNFLGGLIHHLCLLGMCASSECLVRIIHDQMEDLFARRPVSGAAVFVIGFEQRSSRLEKERFHSGCKLSHGVDATLAPVELSGFISFGQIRPSRWYG